MISSASTPFPGDERRHSDRTIRSLSPARQRLVTLAQHQLFGTIRELEFRNGDPIFDPMPRVVRRIKLGGHNTARPQAGKPDSVLKREWVEFFNHLDSYDHGTVLLIEVAHGLPLFFEISQIVSV
jgi:hypothetical protein